MNTSTASTQEIILSFARKFSAEGSVSGDYKAGKLTQFVALLERGVVTEKEAIRAANRTIAAVVTVSNVLT